jgi:hypothetical protein
MGLVYLATWALTALLVTPGDIAPSSEYLTMNLVASAIASAAGGAAAMWFAPHAPRGHVYGLAIVLLILSIPTILSPPAPNQPSWYGIVISFVGPAFVVLGGVLAERLKHGPKA